MILNLKPSVRQEETSRLERRQQSTQQEPSQTKTFPMTNTINYRSSGSSSNKDIVLPGEGSKETSPTNSEGIVITPEPSIVIKTKLFKDNGNGSTQSILSISDDSSNRNESSETKVFINICMHELISLPMKRKTIDDESGKEVDAWHLPMSMGELRPCFDKLGNAALAADCIMNPQVVTDMHLDSNHFHFVADLVIQCANRKFSEPCFGGLALDKRYKVPKMKYAGYVDEKTGLPTDIKMTQVNDRLKPVVAKQRIKGNGRSKPIIEELDSPPAVVEPVRSGNHGQPKKQQSPMICIELFVEHEYTCMALQDFLDSLAKDMPPGVWKKQIISPELKQIASSAVMNNLHPSQLLKVPIPFSSQAAFASSIIAKCTGITSDTNMTLEASAFLLVLSSDNHSKTECVLPFLIDSHTTTCTYDSGTKMLEIRMPLLRSMMNAEEGPDPGTKQWEFANAFSGGTIDESLEKTVSNNEDSSADAVQSDVESDSEDLTLPEDLFHKQDALSRHYLKQQEDEKQDKKNSYEQMLASREGDNTEIIDVRDFQSGSQNMEQTNNVATNDTLKKAEEAFKQSLASDGNEYALGSNFVFDLV